MKKLSISFKLLIVDLIVFGLLIVSIVFVVKNQTLNNYIKVGSDFNLASEKMFDSGIKYHMIQTHNRNLTSLLEVMVANRKLDKVRIVGSNGVINYSSDSIEVLKRIDAFEPQMKDLDLDSVQSRLSLSIDENHNIFIIPIKNHSKCQNCHEEKNNIAFLISEINHSEIMESINTTVNNIFLAGGILIIFTIIILHLSHKFLIFNRLSKIKRGMEKVKGGNLDHRLRVKSIDEVGNLESYFNVMTKELKNYRAKSEELYFEKIQNLDKLVTLGQLTSSIAHEINNYSGILLSRLEYLKYEFELNSNQTEYIGDVNSMIDQVNKMSFVTSNILKHSRQNTKTKEINDIFEIIKEDINLLKKKLLKSNIDVDISQLDHHNLVCNKSQMEQVFINLIINSIDSIGSGSKIKISSKLLNDKFIITFADDGNGIKEEDLENIFLPFFTTKENDKGTGLGLFIIKKLLDNHNASIECDSKLNVGTTFTLKFEQNDEKI